MSPAAAYALATFSLGVLLLLGWAYATLDNPRSGALFRTSLWLFALPILVAPISWMQFPLSLWVLVAFEEGLKAFGAQREDRANDRFWLISLFGLWELTLDKPFYGWLMGDEIASWTRLQVSALLFATALPVLMHVVTAAIYAFRWQGRIWAAFLMCWAIHTAFNEAVTYFYPSVPATAVVTVLLLAILIAALPSSFRPSFLWLRHMRRTTSITD